MLVLFYIFVAFFLPLPSNFLEPWNRPTTKIFDRKGQLLYEVIQPDKGKKSLTPLQNIPSFLIQATLASEDVRFYSHGGVDVGAIARAIFFNVREQRIVSGGSTITQQLVRNLRGPESSRGWGDKFIEALYAVRMSHVYRKDEVLELYLNTIYYGNLAYGVQSAALDYFNKNVSDLDLAESSFLAGLPQSPSTYNPYKNFQKAKERQKYVLAQMTKYSFISQDEANAALAQPLSLRSNKFGLKAPHFVHMIIQQLEEEFGEEVFRTNGLQIFTTLDYDLQLKAEQIIERHVDSLQKNHVTNGALIAMDVRTNQILVWVGSKDYFNEKIDGAVDMVQALRQPGSSIKPLTYLAAFEKGYTPATVLYDIPTQFETDQGPYTPKNYDLQFHGPVRVRTALGSSFNIPAVKTLEYVGVENFISFLRKFGVRTLTQPSNFYGLALTLGGGEVRLIDMAHAYNIIANYGIDRKDSTILKITDGEGKVLHEWHKPEENYILGTHGKDHAYQIIDILKDPLARLPGFGEGTVLEISHEAAVKTGTTRNFRDNWTIGFTPDLLTAVWVGNADGSPMQNVSGVDGAGPIWADFMEAALAFSPRQTFPKTLSVKEVQICTISGKLSSGICPETIYEIFVRGSEPTEKDDYYQQVWIEKNSGQIIQDACTKLYDPSRLEQRVVVVYPKELQRWAAQNGYSIPRIAPCGLSGDVSSGYTDGLPNEQATSVFIDNPLPNDEYLFDYTLPPQDQKIPFRITVPIETIEVHYFVDGAEIAVQKEAPFSFLWLPAKGEHIVEAEAVLVNGEKMRSKAVKFLVR